MLYVPALRVQTKNNKLLAELIGSLDIAKDTEPLLKAWILLVKTLNLTEGLDIVKNTKPY